MKIVLIAQAVGTAMEDGILLLTQLLHDLHHCIRRLRPPAKDWNDLLRLFAR